MSLYANDPEELERANVRAAKRYASYTVPAMRAPENMEELLWDVAGTAYGNMMQNALFSLMGPTGAGTTAADAVLTNTGNQRLAKAIGRSVDNTMAGLPINVLQGLAVDGEAEDKIRAMAKGVLYDALSGYSSSRIEDIAGDAYAWLGKNRARRNSGTDLATMTDDEYYRLVTAHMDAIANDTSAGRAVPDNISAPGQTSDGLSDDEYFRMLQRYVDEGAAGETDGFDEYHENFTQQPNKSDFELAQTTKITKKKYQSNYGKVDRKLVNSKKYHDKFNELTKHSSVNEALYQEATHILEHRDGSPYEDMIILDARTGKYITGNTEVQDIGKTGLTIAQYELFKQHTGDMIIIHNHPNNSRISYKDILTMYQNPKIFAVVALGHDGTVQIVSNLNRNFPVDEYWQKAYNYAMEIYENEMLAVHKATTALYELGIFNTESR